MKSPVVFPNVSHIALCFLAALAVSAVSSRASYAADEFQDLVDQIPRSANAVVLLNMEKAKNSPLGLKEEWKAKIDKAFEAGLFRVPPQATRFVLASQIDFEYKEPLWEVAIMDLDEEISMKQLAQTRGGTLDTIEGLPALAQPNDVYLVQLGPKRLGAMGPGNRQAVVRWIREVRKTTPAPLSPYLERAAVYSDKAGSEIIMAIDLDGVMSFERVAKYLKAHQNRVDEWQTSLLGLTQLLTDVHGIRIGVRIGEQPSGMMVVDMQGDASSMSAFAKPLLLQVLSDSGMMINDFESWTVQAKGSEMSLAGRLSSSGLRRLLSVVDSPVGDAVVGKPTGASPGELPAAQAKASRERFRAILAMADDLKDDMKTAKNLASTSFFIDKYAKRISRMPILNVDPELLDYSGFVAHQLRQASLSVKTMGIQSNVRSAGVVGGDSGGSYGYRSNSGDLYADIKDAGSQRRVIRAEEKAATATDVQQIRQEIIAATADIRRKMTEKYKIEF